MADPFDAVLDDEEKRLREGQGSLATGGSEYDAIAEGEATQRKAALANTLRQAVAINPDEAAQHRALAKANDLPVDTVARNKDIVEQAGRVRDLLEAARSSPVLGRQLLDPNFASLAHDDTEKLGLIESTFEKLKTGVSALASGVPQASRGLWGVIRAFGENSEKALRVTAGYPPADG